MVKLFLVVKEKCRTALRKAKGGLKLLVDQNTAAATIVNGFQKPTKEKA